MRRRFISSEFERCVIQALYDNKEKLLSTTVRSLSACVPDACWSQYRFEHGSTPVRSTTLRSRSFTLAPEVAFELGFASRKRANTY